MNKKQQAVVSTVYYILALKNIFHIKNTANWYIYKASTV